MCEPRRLRVPQAPPRSPPPPPWPPPPAVPAPHATPAELLALPTRHARATSGASTAIAVARDAASLPLAPLPFAPLPPFALRPLLLLLPAPLLLRARLPLEPHVGAAPWPDKEAALAPRRKLAERKFSSHRSVSASSCSPGGTALREGAAPSLPEGPSVCVVGVHSPARRQAPTRTHAEESLGEASTVLFKIHLLVDVPSGRRLWALTRSRPQKTARDAPVHKLQHSNHKLVRRTYAEMKVHRSLLATQCSNYARYARSQRFRYNSVLAAIIAGKCFG
jgi:hypothetical protein